MKTFTRFLFLLIAALLWSSSTGASELVFSQNADGQSTYGPSQFWPAAVVNAEVADDFTAVANVDRVSATGFVWGVNEFQGVYIRFYEFGADNEPGVLQ